MPPETKSMQIIQGLQRQYGSADFENMQALRWRFYSFVDYPEAGQASFTFFGSATGQGGVGLEETNMPKAGSFGQQHFQLKAVAVTWKIGDWDLDAFNGNDNTTLVSDLVAGFAQAGVLELKIGARPFLQVPKPFLYCPPFDGEPTWVSAGLETLTLAEGTPNTFSDQLTHPPFVTQLSARDSKYLVDPNILIEAEQSFEVTISFPSGLVPVIGTEITNDSTNPLQIGVIFDGILYRPLQ